MEIHIQPRQKVNLTFADGSKIEVSKPTLGQVEQMQQDLTSASDAEKLGCIKTFLCKLGLTNESISGLEMDQFTDLLESLTGSKKK